MFVTTRPHPPTFGSIVPNFTVFLYGFPYGDEYLPRELSSIFISIHAHLFFEKSYIVPVYDRQWQKGWIFKMLLAKDAADVFLHILGPGWGVEEILVSVPPHLFLHSVFKLSKGVILYFQFSLPHCIASMAFLFISYSLQDTTLRWLFISLVFVSIINKGLPLVSLLLPQQRLRSDCKTGL